MSSRSFKVTPSFKATYATGCSPLRSLSPHLERTRFHLATHQLDDLTGRKDDLITLGVKDHGKGIPQDRLRQIFLWSKDTQRTGSRGVGLPMCRDLVARNGGNLSVESQAGEGSTFYFTLPEHAPAR